MRKYGFVYEMEWIFHNSVTRVPSISRLLQLGNLKRNFKLEHYAPPVLTNILFSINLAVPSIASPIYRSTLRDAQHR